jgi:hypothetical protein
VDGPGDLFFLDGVEGVDPLVDLGAGVAVEFLGDERAGVAALVVAGRRAAAGLLAFPPGA